jgi:hypothetical protein
MTRRIAALLALGLIAAAPAPVVPGVAPAYADLVALTLASPVIVRAVIARADRLTGENAPGVAPGRARLLVRARLAAAILAPSAVPPEIEYLVEVPLDARGKLPKLKGAEVLLFVRPGGRPGQVVLVSGAAQIAASAAREATVRGVLTEARDATLPVVTGIAQAFHVPGAIPGEAESQFFVSTAAARPVSLVVLSRPGQAKTLSLALGDVIDDAAATVKPNTLLWYRLACFLPRTLPERADRENRAELAADYAFVLASLGPCTRAF